MIVKLLTEQHLEFLSFKRGCKARPSLHLSKCQIVGNLMLRLKYKSEPHSVPNPKTDQLEGEVDKTRICPLYFRFCHVRLEGDTPAKNLTQRD